MLFLRENVPAVGHRDAWRRGLFPMGATLTPLRGTDAITWTARYRNGNVKRFKFPIRTTPWGSITPFPEQDRPQSNDLKAPTLFGEENHLGIDRLPVPTTR